MIFVMEVITKAWEHFEKSLTVVEFQPVTSPQDVDPALSERMSTGPTT